MKFDDALDIELPPSSEGLFADFGPDRAAQKRFAAAALLVGLHSPSPNVEDFPHGPPSGQSTEEALEEGATRTPHSGQEDDRMVHARRAGRRAIRRCT